MCEHLWQLFLVDDIPVSGYTSSVKKKDQTAICDWCGQPYAVPAGKGRSKDHIFSHFLGGTLDLHVYDCPKCQKIIREIEEAAAKTTFWGIERAAKGRGPRNKKSISSGTVIPKYCLVKSSSNRYVDATIRSGRDQGLLLPSLQVCLSPKRDFYLSGTDENKQQIFDYLNNCIKTPPKPGDLLADLSFEQPTDEIAKDEDFWPRLTLDIKGKPTVIARNSEEAKKCYTVIFHAIQQGLSHQMFRPDGSKVKAGTPHHVEMRYSKGLPLKLVAKNVVGSLIVKARQVGNGNIQNPITEQLRLLLLTTKDEDSKKLEAIIVSSTEDARFQNHQHHFSFFYRDGDSVQGVVKIFNDIFSIDFGATKEMLFDQLPFGIYCSYRGGDEKTRFLTIDELGSIQNML